MKETACCEVKYLSMYVSITLDKIRRIFRTELWTALRDILFPERCLACGAGLQGCKDISYCQACLQNVRFIQEPFCTTCGKPFDNSAGESHLCGYCLKHEWHFTKARAVYVIRRRWRRQSGSLSTMGKCMASKPLLP